ALHAQTATACPPLASGQELREPPVIAAKDHKIDTVFKLEEKSFCAPAVQSSGKLANQAMTLRTYVYPDPSNPGSWIWGFPGPTLRLRKPSEPGGTGDSLAILLENDLSSDAGATCDSACPSSVTCPSGTSGLPDPALCPKTQDPQCCCWINVNQKYPD